MLHDKDLVSLQEVRTKVEAAHSAFLKFRECGQQRIDAIVDAMAAAARAEAKRLAEMAVEETRYGNVRDKTVKNLLTADLFPRAIRGMKTVGVLRELPEEKMVEIGVPVGVVAALLPTTNPTSTVIFKSIVSLKAGNAVVLSPHPRAAKCSAYTADLVYKAAVAAGAPEGIIQCVSEPTIDSTHALMKHPRVAVILATGGAAMVRAAYSSGKPAFGVGPGNVPVYLERSADVASAVRQVVDGKSFDYGTVCSSEQALVCEADLRDAVTSALKANGAHFATPEQAQALARVMLKENFRINPECVGQSPQRLAEMAGFSIAPGARIIVAELAGVGKAHPLSVEKLSPVLALYFVRDHAAALDTCEALVRFGGLGHTCVIYSRDEARVREFGLRMPAMRVLVNTASPQGSTGITTNLMPSMTLGCGAMAGNITSDNVGPLHLINIKRVAWKVREPEESLQLPPELAAAGASLPSQQPSADSKLVAALIERYLAERPRPAAPAPAASVADIVDQFLRSRRPCAAAPPRAECPAACPCPQKQPALVAGPQPPQPAQIEPPAPKVEIADFVCENDVRAAIQRSAKIYIGAKTIVTPSARDLGEQHGILVLAQSQ